MKCSFGISDFLEEIPSLPILLFSSISLHWPLKKAFFSLLTILWNSAATPWTVGRQAFLSISQSLLKLTSIKLMMPSNCLILCPFSSCLQSFPTSGSFQISHFFTSGSQSIGVSALASGLAKNIQDWFLLGWTGWISLQSKELSRIFFNTTVQKHQLFGAQL